MAGPLSSEEIEDVVSSVRRLVSNELSPRRSSRDLGADRLLLTPSLRVVSEVSPLAPLVLDEEIAHEAAGKVLPSSTEAPETPADDAVELIEAEWEDEIWATPDAAPLGEVALGAEEAEVLLPVDEQGDLVAAIVEPAEQWVEAGSEPDTPTPLAPLQRRAESLTARLAAGEVVDKSAEDSEPTVVTGQSATVEVASAAVLSMPADDLPGTPDPEIDRPDVAAPDDPLFQHDETPDHAAMHDSGSQRMATEIIDADGTPLAVLDEAALQEIVRQMIREELQGNLGERITRNVRKLVRAEINRALIARDLD